MIMHSSIPKSKPKKLSKEYLQWLEKLSKPVPKFSRNSSTFKKIEKSIPSPKIPPGRETPNYKSLNPNNMSVCSKNDVNQYTGTKMLGIGTLHKSNAVPVFNNDEAVDMAKMRR